MWEKVKFTDIVKDVTGGNTKLNQNKYLSIGKYPIIDQGEKFIGGYFDDDLTLKISKPVVVFGDHSRCIKYIDFDFILGADGVKVLEPLQNLDSKYLFYFLKTIKLPNVGYSRHFKFLKESIIPLPPLHIQEKIAEILDKADELRRKDQELQAKYDQLAQAIFIDMFGDPVKNEKGWAIVPFGNVINVITDYHANGSYKILNENVKLKNSPDYALMVRTTDLENENFTKDCIYINEYEYNFLKKTKVYGGELIISKIGSAGKVYQMPNLNRPVSLGMNCFLIRINSDINTTFLYSYLKSKYGEREINKRIFGAVTKTITKDAVRDIPLILPPIHLQEEFAKNIEIINQLKAQANAEKSEELFQSLLQKAFKGELVS